MQYAELSGLRLAAASLAGLSGPDPGEDVLQGSSGSRFRSFRAQTRPLSTPLTLDVVAAKVPLGQKRVVATAEQF